VSQLQKEYPVGPVLLAGYCRGSLIAMEVAAQLESLGRPVMQMVLFDPQTDPDNLTRYFNSVLRPALGKKDSSRRSWLSRHWFNRQRKHLRHLLLAGRWTDGAQAGDFGHEGMRRMYERRYRKLMRAGRYGSRAHLGSKHAQAIWDAQAKLLAAYHQYLPRPFAGPATVFASDRVARNFEKGAFLWRHLLPNRTVHALGETHAEVIQAEAATGARLMQDVFDAALSRHA
jgi:thioesterase domain-containing protein